MAELWQRLQRIQSIRHVYGVVVLVGLFCVATEASGFEQNDDGRTLALGAALDLAAFCLFFFFWSGSIWASQRACRVIPSKGLDLSSDCVDNFGELVADDLNSGKLTPTYDLDSEAPAIERPQQRKREQSRVAQLRKEFSRMIEVAQTLVTDPLEDDLESDDSCWDLGCPDKATGHSTQGLERRLPLYIPSTIYNYHAMPPQGFILPVEAAATQYEPVISTHLCRLLEDRIAVSTFRSIGLRLPSISE